MRLIAATAALGAVRRADLDLTAGRYVVLSSEQEPLHSLAALLAGREPPRSGRVELDGSAPHRSPPARKKIAALFHDEGLPPAVTVHAAVCKALKARGESVSDDGARTLLVDAGLGQLVGLAPASLGARETRSVALTLALVHDRAQLFVLHEPLATLVPASFVLSALDRHTSRGAIVLSSTTSPADAALLGGRWLCFELGRVSSSESAIVRLGQGSWQQVLVETSDPRALSRALQESDASFTSELGASARSLHVTGPALDETVREIISLARRHELEIFRIEPAVPAVEALMAARAGFARGAYEAARAAALGAPPPPPPAANTTAYGDPPRPV